MKKTIIGIDISKLTVDICVQVDEKSSFHCIENNPKALRLFFRQFAAQSIMIGMENTGRYNFFLYEILRAFSFTVYVINPLHIKKSMGLVRGKSDKIDSKRIALFLEKHYMDLNEWNPTSQSIHKIKLLNTERRHRVKIRAGLLAQYGDKQFVKSVMDKTRQQLNSELIGLLDKQIAEIEEKLLVLVKEEETLNNQYNRIQSIPGVGKVLAMNILIKTNGFTEIVTARQMACYAGVAPFEHRSGSSIRYKPKVSPMADKELKKLLHLASMSAIRLENDLAIYFKRKVSEGKNKMSVLNAIRNKIIHRIYALIKNEKYYQNNLNLS